MVRVITDGLDMVRVSLAAIGVYGLRKINLGLGYMHFLTPGQRKIFIEALSRDRKIVCVT